MNAISLVMETGFAITAFLALFLNLFLPEEIEDEVIDVVGKEQSDNAAMPGPSAPNKGIESSRASDADSVDKINGHGPGGQAKEVSP